MHIAGKQHHVSDVDDLRAIYGRVADLQRWYLVIDPIVHPAQVSLDTSFSVEGERTFLQRAHRAGWVPLPIPRSSTRSKTLAGGHPDRPDDGRHVEADLAEPVNSHDTGSGGFRHPATSRSTSDVGITS